MMGRAPKPIAADCPDVASFTEPLNHFAHQTPGPPHCQHPPLVTSYLHPVQSTQTRLLAVTGYSKSATLSEVHLLVHSTSGSNPPQFQTPEVHHKPVFFCKDGPQQVVRPPNEGAVLPRSWQPCSASVSRATSRTRWTSLHLRGQRWTPACPAKSTTAPPPAEESHNLES